MLRGGKKRIITPVSESPRRQSKDGRPIGAFDTGFRTIRVLTYAAAINEGLRQCLDKYPEVFIVGEGVPDPSGIFGTTLGLQEKYGRARVMDMPVSENGLTGICIGAAISGLRPVMTHQRIDFSLLSFDQIVNCAAKWFYMFGGKRSVPIVIRMIIGRGWGQGAQHSQSLQSLYAHIPGLKVVMPTFPSDAKGMLISAVKDNNPVIFIEHRWLHQVTGDVPEGYYEANLNQAAVIKRGRDVTIICVSYMTIEGLKAARILKKENINAEIIDLRSLKPIDMKTIIKSLKKTGRVVITDTGVKYLGIGAEILAEILEYDRNILKASPIRISLPDLPTPTSFRLAENYYPTYKTMVEKILIMFGKSKQHTQKIIKGLKSKEKVYSDVPDKNFTGPF